MATSQSARQIGRPKMPAFVLRVEEERRNESRRMSPTGEQQHGEAGGSRAVVEVETTSKWWVDLKAWRHTDSWREDEDVSPSGSGPGSSC